MDFLQRTPDLIQGRDFVITGQQPWDVAIGSNCKNIAEELSRHNRVLYVNAPLDRYTAMREGQEPMVLKRKDVIEGRRDGLEQIDSQLWVLNPDQIIESINWVGSQWLFEVLNLRNNRRFARSIQAAIERLGFKDIILFNDNDIFRSFHLKELLRPSLSIYYSRDYMLAVDYWRKHGEKMEPELIAKSDICVANSVYLAEYCRRYNLRSYYVGQGCDLTAFTSAIGGHIPEDMTTIRKPTIGYVGALQSLRLDISLIEHIAIARPDWSIVLVGPEDEAFKISNLHKLANVHFLGAKQVSEIPAYVNAFDVCINPQLLNEVTVGNYPRKIDEYLAVGKPVVATSTEAMSVFADYTYLAQTHTEYVSLIERALAEDNAELRQHRINFASEHTWEANVRAIYKALQPLTVSPKSEGSSSERVLPKHLFILANPRHDDDLVSTSFMLARELTRYFHVYFIDNPFTYKDYLRYRDTPRGIRRKHLLGWDSDGLLDIGIDRLKVVVTPLLLSIQGLPEGALYRKLLRRNEAIIRRRIRQVLERERIGEFVFLNSFNFHYPEVADKINPVLTVYQSMDPLIMEFDRKHGLVSEPAIVRRSDIVICTAKGLYDQFREMNPETYFLPNAADIQHSSRALQESLPVHPFLVNIPHPIVGYFGNIERRMDYELLITVAEHLKDFNFVFTGPYDEQYIPEAFRQMSNVYFTGKVQYSEMPSVLKGFDVAIIPFKTDEVSSSIFPLKLFEYLGAGKPVVSTLFNPNLREFTGEHVRYANDARAFSASIKEALLDTEEQKQQRIKIASQNTWAHRAKQLANLMRAALEKKRNG